MSFALFLLYLVLTIVRPAEMLPELRAWSTMEIASALALAGAGLAVLMGSSPTFRAPQLVLVAGLWLWALVGVLASPERSTAAIQDVIGFGKSSCTAFLLVVLNVLSVRRLRVAAAVLTASSVFIGLQAAGALPARLVNVLPSDGALGQQGDDTGPTGSLRARDEFPPGDMQPAERIRGANLFGNPNDLAVALLAALPLCLALRRARAPIHNVLAVWAPALLIVYCVYLTRSRGAVLALAFIVMLSLRPRFGTVPSTIAGVAGFLGLLALGFLGGRSIEMDQSAMGRVHAWSDGLQMLKSSPVWGVGYGMFMNYHPRAAHSSIVQCFAELGMIGYLVWLGLIVSTLEDLRNVGPRADEQPELRRWARAIGVSLLGSLVGGLLLSRAFDVILFIQLGLGVALADVARRQGALAATRGLIWLASATAAAAAASIVAVWLYMRLLR
jgi:hypothetical protein